MIEPDIINNDKKLDKELGEPAIYFKCFFLKRLYKRMHIIYQLIIIKNYNPP